MAAIRTRGPHQFQARIRIKGYPEQQRTFRTRLDAERWARSATESLFQGTFVGSAKHEALTLEAALVRYRQEVTPLKKSAAQERGRIRRWLDNPLAPRTLPLTDRPEHC